MPLMLMPLRLLMIIAALSLEITADFHAAAIIDYF